MNAYLDAIDSMSADEMRDVLKTQAEMSSAPKRLMPMKDWLIFPWRGVTLISLFCSEHGNPLPEVLDTNNLPPFVARSVGDKYAFVGSGFENLTTGSGERLVVAGH